MGASDSRPAFSYEHQLLEPLPAGQACHSVEVIDPDQPANATKPRRCKEAENALHAVPYATENGGCPTVYACFQRGVRLAPGAPCFGTRPYILAEAVAPVAAAPVTAGGEEQKESASAPAAAPAAAAGVGKYKIEEKMPARGEYIWETYAEIDEAAKDFGAGLVSMGYQPHTNVGIFSSNRTEWMVAAFGLYAQNMRVVSLYASLGEGAVEYIINHADVPVVLVSKQNLPSLLKSLPNLKNVKLIVQWDFDAKYNNVEDVVAESDVTRCLEHGIELLGFSAVKAKGAANREAIQPNPAKPEDICYIMYTSGTTGNPKGAILLHRNIVATVASVPAIFTLTEKDSYLSYLPLAHIFETIAQTAIFTNGGRIGFFQDNIRKLTADMVSVQPTMFCGVPRVFTRIHQVVMNGVAEKSCLVKWYFNRAFNAQSDLLRAGQPRDAKYDAKVFAPLRTRMGLGSVRVIITGAAPMAPYLAEFLKVVSGVPVLEGYGMTEACAATSIGKVSDIKLGQTGPPVCAVEVRLESIEDMGYHCTDPHPRGEVCVRGPAVFAGYWKDEESTKAAIIDGWLHTGDVGRFNPDGTLSIIDRKKNLFKLSQGEYIAIEKVEQAYQKAGMVGQVWVYGNSFKSFLLAVVVPAAEPTASWLYSKGWWPNADKESTKLLSETFVADYTAVLEGEHKAEIKAWVLENLRSQEKPLKGFEKIMDVIVESRIDKMGMAFTEANECLTPTFKMRRPQLLQRYIVQLKAMYGANNEPVADDEKWPGEQ